MTAHIQQIQQLDGLLALIDQCSPLDEAEYAHEHIQEARMYLLGEMPGEYQHALRLAKDTLRRMNKSATLERARQILANLSGDERPLFQPGGSNQTVSTVSGERLRKT